MTMAVRVQLQRGEWFYDPQRPLGKPGGFGAVFEGTSAGGDPVAVKRLHVTADEAAHRELAVADELAGKPFEHVLVPLDSGLDSNSSSYFVVMPRADRSLHDEISSRGILPEREALFVLRQIASGLKEIPFLVHRDLKPQNVLFHDGRWKIADFGIARFLEASTSLHTVKEALSPPFAAPEQWNLEHATRQTDIYALGCIAHVLLTGRPPFAGPTPSDFKKQHLTESPPDLANTTPKMRAIVAAMLKKPPVVRPDVTRVEQVFKELEQNPPVSPAKTRLQAAHASLVESASKELAAKAQAAIRQREREELLSAARSSFLEMIRAFQREVMSNAPDAQMAEESKLHLTIHFGQLAGLVLRFEADVPIGTDLTTWEVAAIGRVGVVQDGPNKRSRSATLWYMRIPTGVGDFAGYRWYEVGYRSSGLVRDGIAGTFAIQDVGRTGGFTKYQHAEAAARRVMHTYQMESGPIPIDDEHLEAFVERWLSLLVDAFNGSLQ